LEVEPLAGGLLAYEASKGNVHVLDPLSAELWSQAGTGSTLAELEKSVLELGVPVERARQSIDLLFEHGLLESTD
jgi:hypothetical protein